MTGLVQVDWSSFLQSRAWEIVSLLPPGFAARSIGAAGRGEYLLSLGFLLGLLAFTAGTVALAGWLIEQVYAGEGGDRVLGVGRRVTEKARVTSIGSRRSAEAVRPDTRLRLPPVVEAVADKELKYMRRDPYFKIALMNLVYMLVVGALAFLGRPEPASGAGQRPAMLWGVTALMLLSEMQLLFNSFGTEGAAATLLFLFPSSRRQILIGKNLTLFAALSAVNLLLMLMLAALAGALETFGPLFAWMELATIVFIAVGNLTSIWFPVRVVLRGWRIRQQSASRGCGYGFLYLALAAAAYALLVPVLAALLLPSFWVSPAWYALTLPLAVAYAAGLYTLSLRLAAPLLLQRELILVERLGQEE